MFSFNPNISALPPPGYAPLFYLHPISEKSEEAIESLEQEGAPAIFHYVDDDGMHRIVDFEKDLCPPNGSQVVRQCLLNILSNSKNTMELEVYQPVEGSTSVSEAGNHYYSSARNSPPLTFSYPHLSMFYRSYEEILPAGAASTSG